MKRSEIHHCIEIAREVFAAVGLHLPPFSQWTAEQWRSNGADADGIRKAMLGWDVTDFGLGRFDEYGRILFTLRNGYREGGMLTQTYAEKLILDPPNQKPPLHFHRTKMEDIIVRGGGNILIRLWRADAGGGLSDEEVVVQVDGVRRSLAAGTTLRLEPGQSVCIPPCLVHQFWGEEGTGINIDGQRYTVSGEVSSVCDDWNDNCFLEPCQRFPSIEEDQPLRYYLCHEYPAVASDGPEAV